MKTATSLALAPALLISAAALLAVACGSSESEPAAGQPAPPVAPTEPAPPAEPPAAPPAAQSGSQAPGGGIANADAAAGEQHYKTYCASCHGLRGEGDGELAAALPVQPAKHSDAAYMTALSDEHLFTVVKKGGAAVGKSALMAGFGGSLSDEQIWDVVAYVRSLAR